MALTNKIEEVKQVIMHPSGIRSLVVDQSANTIQVLTMEAGGYWSDSGKVTVPADMLVYWRLTAKDCTE